MSYPQQKSGLIKIMLIFLAWIVIIFVIIIELIKKGGGVALYINNRIQYQIIDNLSINIDNCLECTTVKLLLRQNVIVSSIYRQLNSKIDYFTNSIDSMFKSKKGILFLCGDLNINLLDYKLNNHTQHFVDLLFSLSLFPLINRPTQLSNQHASIIDNIFTNAINKNINCGIIMEELVTIFLFFVYHNWM